MRTVKCAEKSKHTTCHFHFRPSELETVTKPYKTKWARQNCTYHVSEVNHEKTSLATCHQLSLWRNAEEKIVNVSSQRVDARPRGSQAKFDSQLVKGFQETDLAGHASSERAIRCAGPKSRVCPPKLPLGGLQSPMRVSFAPQCPASSGHHEFEPLNYRPEHSCLHDTAFLQATLCQWQGCKSEEHSWRHHCIKPFQPQNQRDMRVQ